MNIQKENNVNQINSNPNYIQSNDNYINSPLLPINNENSNQLLISENNPTQININDNSNDKNPEQNINLNFNHAQNKEIINQQNNQGMNQNPIGLQSPSVNNGDYNNSLGNYGVNGDAQNNHTVQQNNRNFFNWIWVLLGCCLGFLFCCGLLFGLLFIAFSNYSTEEE